MATKTLNARICNKRDSVDNWTINNPVLLNGELIVVDMNNGDIRFKLGDGINPYSELPFVGNVETYVHEQAQASDSWEITHDLNKHPSVTVVDSAGTVVIGDIQYINNSRLIATFNGAFSGTAYLN